MTKTLAAVHVGPPVRGGTWRHPDLEQRSSPYALTAAVLDNDALVQRIKRSYGACGARR